MRKLKLQVQITVDGFIAGPQGEMDMMNFNWGDDMNNYVKEITDPVDCVIMGRKLAEGFIPYWADVAANPEHPEHDAGVIFTNTPKVVFTKTLARSDWAQTVLAKGDLVDEITSLKRQDGKDIITYGGAAFASALIQHGLVDEYHLFINPTAIGSGMPIFQRLDHTQNLTLKKSCAFNSGIVLLCYEPVRA